MTKHRRDITAQAKVVDGQVFFDPPLTFLDREVLHARITYDGENGVATIHEAWITKRPRPRQPRPVEGTTVLGTEWWKPE